MRRGQDFAWPRRWLAYKAREQPVKRTGGAQEGFARDSVTWMTYGLIGFFAFMETVLGPMMPFLRRELDLGYTAASLHFSAFALGAVLLGFFGDRIVGRWGRR